MDRDWGARDADFIALTSRVRERLARIVGADHRHTCILLQGSGTFAVEAAIQSFVARHGKLLVLVNGSYGKRIVEIARRLQRDLVVCETDEDRSLSVEEVESALERESGITDVALIHCETTAGILNPLMPIADAVHRRGRRLPLDEEVPSRYWDRRRRNCAMRRAKDNATSLSLDLRGAMAVALKAMANGVLPRPLMSSLRWTRR